MMKWVAIVGRFLAGVGAFFFGAISSVFSSGLCNPASYDLDFRFSGIHTFIFASVYALWEYPAVTLAVALLAGIFGSFVARKSFQKERPVLAWALGGAGYCLLLLMAFCFWSIYQVLSGSGGYD